MAYWKDEIRQDNDNNKRIGPDNLVKWIRFSSIFCWLLFFLTVLVWDSARPQIYSILDIHYGKVSRSGWDLYLLDLATIFSVITFAFALVSLLISTNRTKRKGDRMSISLIVCTIVSGLVMIGFFIYTLYGVA